MFNISKRNILPQHFIYFHNLMIIDSMRSYIVDFVVVYSIVYVYQCSQILKNDILF